MSKDADNIRQHLTHLIGVPTSLVVAKLLENSRKSPKFRKPEIGNRKWQKNRHSTVLICSHPTPHPALELETGIYIVFDYGTSILGQKYRDFEDCSSVDG